MHEFFANLILSDINNKTNPTVFVMVCMTTPYYLNQKTPLWKLTLIVMYCSDNPISHAKFSIKFR
jgi:hypothetical protein